MLAPYRTPPPPEEPLPPPRHWLFQAVTRAKRKTQLWWGGTFKKRYPYRCPVCSKPANIKPVPWATGYELSFSDNYSPCGHNYGVFDRIRQDALKLTALRALKEENARRPQTHGGGPR